MESIEDLKAELEFYQEQDYQRWQAEADARKAREEGRKIEAYYEARTATTWPEAFRKQIALIDAEMTTWSEEEKATDTYFTNWKQSCQEALAIWQEEADRVAPEIKALQQQIRLLETSIRDMTAKRLGTISQHSAYNETVQFLLQHSPASFLEW